MSFLYSVLYLDYARTDHYEIFGKVTAYSSVHRAPLPKFMHPSMAVTLCDLEYTSTVKDITNIDPDMAESVFKIQRAETQEDSDKNVDDVADANWPDVQAKLLWERKTSL